jgi:hypothetical protein
VATDSKHAEPVETGWLNTNEAGLLLCGVKGRTVRNHITHGVRLGDGKVVKLRAMLLGGNYYTRREWVDEYLQQQADRIETLLVQTRAAKNRSLQKGKETLRRATT